MLVYLGMINYWKKELNKINKLYNELFDMNTNR